MNVEFVFQKDGEPLASDALADDYDLAMLFEHTQEQVRRHVSDRLGTLRCPDHDQPPRVTVTLAYLDETGQTELAYHLDTCCQRFLLDSVRRLNR
jgi:hypothetical protein